MWAWIDHRKSTTHRHRFGTNNKRLQWNQSTSCTPNFQSQVFKINSKSNKCSSCGKKDTHARPAIFVMLRADYGTSLGTFQVYARPRWLRITLRTTFRKPHTSMRRAWARRKQYKHPCLHIFKCENNTNPPIMIRVRVERIPIDLKLDTASPYPSYLWKPSRVHANTFSYNPQKSPNIWRQNDHSRGRNHNSTNMNQYAECHQAQVYVVDLQRVAPFGKLWLQLFKTAGSLTANLDVPLNHMYETEQIPFIRNVVWSCFPSRQKLRLS